MSYSQLYQLLKDQFSPGTATHIPGEDGLLLKSEPFHSTESCHVSRSIPNNRDNQSFDIEDRPDNPNGDFSYPVFYPNDKASFDQCIILLHGLNERSWDKYLPWGYQLAKNTGRPVILFPIAYHMNRSPHEWSNPRAMMPFVKQRKNRSQVSDLTVANVALSQRLTDQPERFLLSGYQAANDILQLTNRIHSGLHPAFKKGTQIDFFTYSIGTFLAQNLILAHGNDLLSNSKFFFFCGGSTFSEMHGISRYIMDSLAFNRLINYYNVELKTITKKQSQLNSVLNHTALGDAFSSMISLASLKRKGQNYFNQFKDRISAVSLAKDSVILPEAIHETLKGTAFEIWDFDFNYSHEVPFPILTNKLVNKVNEAFDRLFIKASMLFTH